MVEYAAREKHMKVKTFSNGTTIKKNIDKIIHSSLNGITISLNGHNAEEFSRMTGCSSHTYPIILNAVDNLIRERDQSDSKVKIKLSFIIDRENFRFIPEMINTGEQLGVDSIFLCNFLPSTVDGFRAEERMLFSGNLDAANTIKEIYTNLPEKLKRMVSFPEFVNKESRRNKCDAHFTQMRVDGEGRVSSCSVMLLNMDGQGYFYDKNVWNNNFFHEMRQRFLNSKKNDLLEPCRVCPDNFGLRTYE